MMPLPIVPPRLAGEGLRSWLLRTARVYDLGPHELIDDWSGARQDTELVQVEARIADLGLHQAVAEKMRVLESERPPHHGRWIIRLDQDVAVCPVCLRSDDTAGRPRYLRAGWSFAWNVTCDDHPFIPLQCIDDWEHAPISPQWPAVQRNATGRILRCSNQSGISKKGQRGRPRARDALRVIRGVERTITRALAGKAPRRASWGSLTPSEFLNVIEDSMTYVLSRFDGAPPIASQISMHFADPGPWTCFARSALPRCLTSSDDIRSLVNARHVGWRRLALLGAFELMNARTARTWLSNDERQSRSRRLATLLAAQNSTSLTWLSDRMQRWPAVYRDIWWSGARRVGFL